MYKGYARNMRYWKPTQGDKNYIEASFPFVLVIFKEDKVSRVNVVRKVVNGSYPANKKEVDDVVKKLTEGVAEEKFVLTAFYFIRRDNSEKVVQLGRFKRIIRI